MLFVFASIILELLLYNRLSRIDDRSERRENDGILFKMKIINNTTCLLVIVGTISSLTIIIIFHQTYDQQLKIQSTTKELLNDGFVVHARPVQHGSATSVDSSSSFRDDDSCFVHNSKHWLESSERLGNTLQVTTTTPPEDDTTIIDDYIRSTILNIDSFFSTTNEWDKQQLLKQTICHKESKLLTSSIFDTTSNNSNNSINNTGTKEISYLSLQLLYFVIHIHQHKHAMKESQARFQNNRRCAKQIKEKQIGIFDYECPDANFLIVPMKQRGLGAVMRTDVTTAFIAGIASNRVVLFMNNIQHPSLPEYIHSPWEWSSCPRRDKQCFFLPDSPCVITKDELINATVLEKGERRKLFKTGRLPDHVNDQRVVVMNTITRPQRTPSNLLDRIIQIINTDIVEPIKDKNPNHHRILPIIYAAMDHIRLGQQDDNSTTGGNSLFPTFGYFGRDSPIHHAMVFYGLRPHFVYAKRIDDMIDQTFKEQDIRATLKLGLPIRASDKCIDEAECPSFDHYIELMETIWDDLATSKKTLQDSNMNVSIILTSESSEIFRAQKQFEADNKLQFPLISSNMTHLKQSNMSPFHFITNTFDVIQDSGNPTKMKDFSEPKEEILMSALASLKMQMNAERSVGNCCSNHHLLLFDYLQEGCGAAPGNVGQCMQDHDNPKFHLCCGWTKTEECLAKQKTREQQQQGMAK